MGLVNVGEEPGKGTDLAKEAHGLISRSGVRFVGNVEGRDVAHRRRRRARHRRLHRQRRCSRPPRAWRGRCSGWSARPSRGIWSASSRARRLRPRLVGIRDQVDPENYGGSFLLGVRGPVVIGHGNSRARGVENALLGISRSGDGPHRGARGGPAAPPALRGTRYERRGRSARSLGVGRALGSRVVTNKDLEGVLDTTDDWISSRTGIHERRFVGEDEILRDPRGRRPPGTPSSTPGIDGGTIDLIVCGTSTAPESMPSVACLVGRSGRGRRRRRDGPRGGLLRLLLRGLGRHSP